MKFDILQTTGIVATVIACIIIAYFISTSKKSSGNHYLALLLLVYSIMIISSIILSSGVNPKLFKWAHVGNQSILLIGPALYFYLKILYKPDFQLSGKHVLHAVPFIFVSAYLILKLFYISIPIQCRFNHIYLGSFAFVHSFIYLNSANKTIKNRKLTLKNSHKTLTDSEERWLPFLIYGCFSIWLVKLLFFVVWDVSGFYNGCNEIVNLYFLISFFLLTLFILFILKNPHYFQNTEKYKNSSLTDKEKLTYKEKLVLIMEDDKAYRNPLISLHSLARQLSIPDRYLSQIINETLDKSFYDLINWYRIKDCAECLTSPDNTHKTILEIAYDAGFNSKSTFNSSFIKYLGVTPKEYRRNHNMNYKVKAKLIA